MSFREGPLRRQLHLDLPAQELAGGLLVLPDVGADGAPDAVLGEQRTQPEAVHPTVVAHSLQVGGPLGEHRLDEPSAISATASAAEATTLFMTGDCRRASPGSMVRLSNWWNPVYNSEQVIQERVRWPGASKKRQERLP